MASDDDDEEVLHSYVAPPACPDATELRARLASATRQVDVTIDPPGKSGRFTVSGRGTREVQGKDCAEVLAQLSFDIALALDLPRDEEPPAPPAPPPAPRVIPVVVPEARDASEPLASPSPSWSDRNELSVGGMAGLFSADSDAGAYFAAQLLYRRGLFAGGAMLEYSAGDERFVGGAAQLGVSLPAPRWLHVDLLGTLGALGYASHFSLYPDGHDAKTIGFVGGRATVTYDFSLLSVGISGSVESDLARVTSDVAVEPRFTLGPFAAVRLDL